VACSYSPRIHSNCAYNQAYLTTNVNFELWRTIQIPFLRLSKKNDKLSKIQNFPQANKTSQIRVGTKTEQPRHACALNFAQMQTEEAQSSTPYDHPYVFHRELVVKADGIISYSYTFLRSLGGDRFFAEEIENNVKKQRIRISKDVYSGRIRMKRNSENIGIDELLKRDDYEFQSILIDVKEDLKKIYEDLDDAARRYNEEKRIEQKDLNKCFNTFVIIKKMWKHVANFTTSLLGIQKYSDIYDTEKRKMNARVFVNQIMQFWWKKERIHNWVFDDQGYQAYFEVIQEGWVVEISQNYAIRHTVVFSKKDREYDGKAVIEYCQIEGIDEIKELVMDSLENGLLMLGKGRKTKSKYSLSAGKKSSLYDNAEVMNVYNKLKNRVSVKTESIQISEEVSMLRNIISRSLKSSEEQNKKRTKAEIDYMEKCNKYLASFYVFSLQNVISALLVPMKWRENKFVRDSRRVAARRIMVDITLKLLSERKTCIKFQKQIFSDMTDFINRNYTTLEGGKMAALDIVTLKPKVENICFLIETTSNKFEVHCEGCDNMDEYLIMEIEDDFPFSFNSGHVDVGDLGMISRRQDDIELHKERRYLTGEMVIAFLMYGESLMQRKKKVSGSIYYDLPYEVFEMIFKNLVWRWFKYEKFLEDEKRSEESETT
jgi:hypothetical protein